MASAAQWRAEIDRIIELDGSETLSQAQMIGILNAAAGERDVIVNAAGSMPGELHRLWRPGSLKGYDIEYGNSCMGYEIPGAIGNALADRSRRVFGLIGDGTYLMLSQEIMTAVQEGLTITFVIVDNFGYGSIAALSETRGSQAFGTRFLTREKGGRLDGDRIEVDFAGNAESYGARVWKADTADGFRDAVGQATAFEGPCSSTFASTSRGASVDPGLGGMCRSPRSLRSSRRPAPVPSMTGRNLVSASISERLQLCTGIAVKGSLLYGGLKVIL